MKKRKNNKSISIGGRLIGDKHPAFIIAEAGINHNGNVDVAKQLIDIAHKSGADAVKFQMRDLEDLYTENTSNNIKHEDIGTQYIYTFIKNAQLEVSHFSQLVKYCADKGIIFLCTPWDKKSVDQLEALGTLAYKIASADLVNFELLEYVALKKKPMLVSTGMSTIDEIIQSVEFLEKLGAEFALLHCNSSYPSHPKDLNLRFLQKLKKISGNRIVGYSGHELGIATTLATIPLGAKIIERHITVDKKMPGPDQAISLDESEFKELVEGIRRIEEALKSSDRHITSGEYINRKILGKSLVATTTIRKGDKITRHMITSKSPAKGLSPQKLFDLVGKKAPRNMAKDEYFQETDIDSKISRKHTDLKGNYGIIVRPHDYKEMLAGTKPKCVEFHLSSKDLENEIVVDEEIDSELIVHAPELWGSELLDLCSNDVKKVNNSVANINRLVEIVQKLRKYFIGTPKNLKFIVHPGGMSFGKFVGESDRKIMLENLSRSIEKIDRNGIDLLLENLPPFPWYKGGQWNSNIFIDADEIKEFSEENKINICYDTSHAQLYCNFSGKDPVKFFDTVKPFMHHAHIADAKGLDSEGLQIGTGNTPFAQIMPQLIETKVTFTPEIWMGHQNHGEGFWIALEELKKYFRGNK